MKFQHTAARRRLVFYQHFVKENKMFQHTAARRRLGGAAREGFGAVLVSTHSRPKAAGECEAIQLIRAFLFQHTAARRRLVFTVLKIIIAVVFQHTAARRRLALNFGGSFFISCFNTQPPEGGW